MGEHLNRLNKIESIEWDKAFKIFCKTGVWNMGQAKRTEEERLVKESKKRIMADPTGGPFSKNRFPGSRDWDLEGKISCANKKCICHKQSFGKGVCLMPSRCAIDSHGKCTGYQPRPKVKTKVKKKKIKKKVDKQIWREIL